jgi:hypothetical protein
MEGLSANQLAIDNTIKKNTKMNVKPSYTIVHKNLNHFSIKLSPGYYNKTKLTISHHNI